MVSFFLLYRFNHIKSIKYLAQNLAHKSPQPNVSDYHQALSIVQWDSIQLKKEQGCSLYADVKRSLKYKCLV